MNTFKKKSLYTALAGLTALGAAGAAQAVNVNPDGTGQVLVYPYYTVNSINGNAYNSLLSVANSTGSTKAVKVRFREAKNSKEVLDFNVFLSPHDMWTAALVPNAGDGGTTINTTDTSCTLPTGVNGQNFRNLAYSGDSGGDGLDRTRDGYVEIFEMATYATTTTTYTKTLHTASGGPPPGCATLTDTAAATEASAPGGGLFGGMQLVNVSGGASASFAAVALDNFRTAPLYIDTGTLRPAMGDADPNSAVIAGQNLIVSTGWIFPADAVSAAITHDAVLNEYVLDTGSNSQTNWVVTFPTKNEYVADGTGAATPPFTNNFDGNSCDEVSLQPYDREEQTPSGGGVDFSPRVPGKTSQLCWEANVVAFNGFNLFGTPNTPLNVTGYTNGWMRLGLADASASAIAAHQIAGPATSFTVSLATGASTARAATTYVGMPVVGFAVFTYSNNGAVTINGVPGAAKYGMGYEHRFHTTVTP